MEIKCVKNNDLTQYGFNPAISAVFQESNNKKKKHIAYICKETLELTNCNLDLHIILALLNLS